MLLFQIMQTLSYLILIFKLNSFIRVQQILLHKMDSSSGQQPKQQRRKRKDPESRDFVCRCGKSYLSYAAAYTHVKNKHSGDNDFLTNISKPDREKLKRGRPKQKKVFCITPETEKLSIVQEAILQIFQTLERTKEANTKIILEGNNQIRLDELFNVYNDIKKQLGQPGLTLFIDREKYGETGAMLNQFIQSLNKHFTSHVAAKVIWFVNYVFAPDKAEDMEGDHIAVDLEKAKQRAGHEVCSRLWEGSISISESIFAALEKWVKTSQKGHESGLKNQL